MKISRRILAPLPIVVVAIALLACKKGGSPGEVKGSCDMRNSSGGGSKMCLDFHSEPNDRVRAICSPAMARPTRGTWPALGALCRGDAEPGRRAKARSCAA